MKRLVTGKKWKLEKVGNQLKGSNFEIQQIGKRKARLRSKIRKPNPKQAQCKKKGYNHTRKKTQLLIKKKELIVKTMKRLRRYHRKVMATIKNKGIHILRDSIRTQRKIGIKTVNTWQLYSIKILIDK